jgi:P-type conjugative transfer protein TrbJ
MFKPRVVTPALILSLLAMTTVPPAGAGGLISPYPLASELTQLLNNAQLVMQYSQQVQQYATQLQQLQRQLKDGTVVGAQVFGPIRSDLVGLQQVVQGGNALSYAMGNLDSEFTSRFAALGYAPSTSYAARYAQWSKTSMATTQAALDAAGLQSKQLSSEEALIEQLQTMSQSSDGQLKAIQVGSQIAAMQVQELMKLRQLMMADMQSKAAFQAQQLSQTDEQNRALGFFRGTQLYKPY